MSIRQPRLWAFNQHYPPDALASAAILEAICVGLVECGWEVTAFVGEPFLLPPDVTWRRQADECRHDVRVVRLPSWNRRAGTFGRLMHYGVYTASALAQWTRAAPPDVTLCLTTPPVFAALVGAVGSVLRDVPFVYNTQDLFPDILETSRYAGTWIESLGRATAGIVERRAARIVPIGMPMHKRLCDRGIDAAKLITIPNPVDVDAIAPRADTANPWLQALSLEADLFRVVYAGNFGHAQGLSTVVEAAALLRGRGDIRFLLVGAGDGKAVVAAQARGLTNLSIHDFAPAAQVLSAGHVGLVPLKAGMGSYLVPSKATHYLAAGVPIVGAAEPGSDMEALVREAGCGFTYAPGDAQGLADTIVRAAADRDGLKRMAAAGRAYVHAHYAGPVIAAAFDRLLREVMLERVR